LLKKLRLHQSLLICPYQNGKDAKLTKKEERFCKKGVEAFDLGLTWIVQMISTKFPTLPKLAFGQFKLALASTNFVALITKIMALGHQLATIHNRASM